ncbi:hypothetical protein [Haliangium ochraceum]|nr:hypothetical protein [Haliangium ochraceum]
MRRIGNIACFTTLAAWAVLGGLGCDPSATVNSNDNALDLSRQHESCASSMDCAEGLRCFEQTCRSSDTSLLGEYYAAVGARSLAGGDGAAAIDAYAAAINRFGSDRKPVPAEVRCGHGFALLTSNERERAEDAANSLHRCLNAAPPGSPLRAKALAGLAALGEQGLDPELLAQADDQVAEYLTKKPAAPSTDELKVTAEAAEKVKARSFPGFLELIQSEEARGPLLACWTANWESSGDESLSVSLPFRYRFEQGAYAEDDRDRLSVEGDEPAVGTPERCVYDVMSSLSEQYVQGKRTGSRWDTEITIRVGA